MRVALLADGREHAGERGAQLHPEGRVRPEPLADELPDAALERARREPRGTARPPANFRQSGCDGSAGVTRLPADRRLEALPEISRLTPHHRRLNATEQAP